MPFPVSPHRRRIQLAKRDLLSLDAQAHHIVCESGLLWITQDRDPQDILLEAGGSFVADPDRRAIVYALDPAWLTVSGGAGP